MKIKNYKELLVWIGGLILFMGLFFVGFNWPQQDKKLLSFDSLVLLVFIMIVLATVANKALTKYKKESKTRIISLWKFVVISLLVPIYYLLFYVYILSQLQPLFPVNHSKILIIITSIARNTIFIIWFLNMLYVWLGLALCQYYGLKPADFFSDYPENEEEKIWLKYIAKMLIVEIIIFPLILSLAVLGENLLAVLMIPLIQAVCFLVVLYLIKLMYESVLAAIIIFALIPLAQTSKNLLLGRPTLSVNLFLLSLTGTILLALLFHFYANKNIFLRKFYNNFFKYINIKNINFLTKKLICSKN